MPKGKTQPQEPTAADVLVAINQYANKAEERFATKDDLKQTEDRLMVVLDKIVVNTQHLGIERIAHQHWLERHEQILQKLQPKAS